jgi:uncharacterized protein (DUF983 family)
MSEFGDKGSRDLWRSVRRAAAGQCPACAQGRLFRKFLKVADRCSSCGEALFHHRADDAPPYVTILIVGHLVIPWVWVLEVYGHPPIWAHWAVWIPLVLVMSLALLPIFKGAIVGLQWALRMHGFSAVAADEDRDATFLPSAGP